MTDSAEFDASRARDVRPGEPGAVPTPWWQDTTDVGGIGMARFCAWAALLIGAGALGIALFAPLQGDALRTVWITGFGAVAIWIGSSAFSRYQREGVRVSWTATVAMVLGGLSILVAIYAFVVIAAATMGMVLPAPEHWMPMRAPIIPGVPT